MDMIIKMGFDGYFLIVGTSSASQGRTGSASARGGDRPRGPLFPMPCG